VRLTERIVREGQREAMPSFSSRISRSGIRAVAVYVNAAARAGL
jgi:mono/diheme cytochrome c family protein